MRKNPWQEEVKYIAAISNPLRKRLEEVGITDEYRRGWDKGEEFMDGEVVLVSFRNATKEGDTYELLMRPDERLSQFLATVAEFKEYIRKEAEGLL